MALIQFNVTLGSGATPVTNTRTPVYFVRIESDSGNALVKFGNSSLSSANYAGSVVANTATADNSVTIGPFVGYLLNLNDLYLLGTAGQTVRITAIS
jgi:hypothetical protein